MAGGRGLVLRALLIDELLVDPKQVEVVNSRCK